MNAPTRFRAQVSLRIIVLILNLFCLWSGFGATYAVVTGVDDYPGAQLSSCTNDAIAVAAFLTSAAGVPEANLHLLLDQQATASAIEDALHKQCHKASAADEVFFYYSGHGTIIPDWNGKGQLIKALVPYGALPAPSKPSNFLGQDRLKRIMADTHAARVVVVLDCCHAGTWTRSITSSTEAMIKSVDVGWGAAEGQYMKSAADFFPEFSSKSVVVHYTWLGACQSNQVSYCGKQLSQFTEKFLSRLRQSPSLQLAVMFPDLAKEVESATNEHRNGTQTPQAEGDLDMPLLVSLKGVTGVIPAQPIVNPSQPSSAEHSAVASAPPSPPAIIQSPPSERQDFALTVELNKSKFLKNEKLQVTVTPERDCYLRLYLVNAKVAIQQIFPNEYQQKNFLRGGEKVQVPSAQGGTFDFVMEGPWGVETIVAVAATEQFTDLQKPVYRDGFFELGNETPGGVLARGIGVRRREPTPTPAVTDARTAPLKVSISKVQYLVSEKASP